jgi:hypothetical protein
MPPIPPIQFVYPGNSPAAFWAGEPAAAINGIVMSQIIIKMWRPNRFLRRNRSIAGVFVAACITGASSAQIKVVDLVIDPWSGATLAGAVGPASL